MLSPHDRTALFDALRPPPGYVLDQAVGTSFTLDLEALLTAPIAFALFASRDADPTDDGLEPVGLLEAIRRHAARITMFCQAGQIAVPARHRTVFAWLEAAVREVAPPQAHRIFHPKVWLARYQSSTGDHRLLRLLCGTRNLTFDTSWDTLLRLESDPYTVAPAGVQARQAQVVEFVRQLPDMAVQPIDAARRAAIEDIASDLATVRLAVPEPYDDMALHVLGLDRTARDILPASASRAVVVSPFLSEPWLHRFTDRHVGGILVSREESLDRVPAEALAAFERIAVLNPAADVAPEQAGVAGSTASTAPVMRAPTDAGDPARLFGGLHAKLYVFDTPYGAAVFTGSANATEAAFAGNVEVVAELRGPASAGVARLLDDTPGETSFGDLLVDYRPLDQPTEASDAEQLELVLDELRRRLAAVPFEATVQPVGEDFELTLTSGQPLPRLDGDADVTVAVRPVTLADRQAATTLALGEAARATFGVTLEGISAFFAMTATARRDSVSVSTTFIVTTNLIGAPPDRESRLLAAMLRDPDRLLRYLLLLLADADPLLGTGDGDAATRWIGGWGGSTWDDIPLLELLVRAADRFPDRLDHIEHLLRDLGSQGETVLPPGFETVWEPVMRFHQDREVRR